MMPEISKDNKSLTKFRKQKEILEEQTEIAKEKKSVAETELEIAKLQKALKEINIPKGKTKPLKGEISTNANFGYLSELVAFHAVKSSAEEAGDQIKQLQLHSGSKILVVDNLNFAEMNIPLIQIKNQFAFFENALDIQIEKNKQLISSANHLRETRLSKRDAVPTSKQKIRTIGGVLTSVTGAISAVADIAGYFKVDYSIKERTVEIDSDAITAIVTGKISEKYDVHIINFHMMDESRLLKRFEELIQKRGSIEADKERLSKDKTPEVASAIEESENIMKAFDIFVTSIATAKESQKQPLIVLATKQDYIRQMGITHLLHLKISSSGGEAITEKRIFTSGHTAFIGGGTISYILAQSDGKVISADALVAFSELDYKISSGKSPKIRVVKLP